MTYSISTSNHNNEGDETPDNIVVTYSISTSNHNYFLGRAYDKKL